MQNVIKNYIQITTPKYAVIAVLMASIVFAMPRLLKAVTRQIWRSALSVCIGKAVIHYTKPKYRLTAMVCRHLYIAMLMWLQAVTGQICKREINKNNCKKLLTNKLMYDRIIYRKTDTTEIFRVFVGAAIHI